MTRDRRPARAAARHGRERRPRRRLPRQRRDPHRRRAGPERDQRARPRELRARRRAATRARRLAGAGAPGAGRRGPHLRDHDQRRRPGLRPVRRHAQPDVPGLPERDADHRRGRRRHARRGRHLRRQPVVTYFFSTSGGYTEDVENVFTGATPEPWLHGVEDPYDDSSPYHRWGPYTSPTRGFAAKLGGWVRGRFRGLNMLQRGVSPRVVRAEVRGSGGSTVVTGPQLRARLGLRDTWFYVRRVSSTTSSGRRGPHGAAAPARWPRSAAGSARRGERFVKLQRRVDGKWVKVVDVPLERQATDHVVRRRLPRPRRRAGRVSAQCCAGWAPALKAATVAPSGRARSSA